MGISAGGALGGAGTGATIGSAIPGLGTAAGAIIGGILGLFSGKKKPTQYRNNMTPEQQGYYTNLLRMLSQRNQMGGAGANPSNQMLQMLMGHFFNRPNTSPTATIQGTQVPQSIPNYPQQYPRV